MIKLEMSLEEAQLVLVGLSKLPYEAVANLIVKIKEQGEAQINSAPAAAPTADVAAE